MHPEVSDEDLKEENSIDEAEVNSDEEFMEYTMTVLKKAFGEDFDEAKAKETAEGILAKADGDYGAAIGMLTSGLGEAEEVSEERAAEIEKEILDMGKPEELKTGDDLVTQDQDVTVEPKGEADDTADGTEIEMAKGDGSETAAGIAGDMMDMGEPKEKPESLGAALVSDEQEVTATVERRVMDFNTFVNESYNRSVNEAVDVEKAIYKAAPVLKKYDFVEMDDMGDGEVAVFSMGDEDGLYVYDDGKGNLSALMAKSDGRYTEFSNGSETAEEDPSEIKKIPLAKLNPMLLKKMLKESYNRSVNEANGSSDYQFNVYSDWSDDANTSTKLTVYAVPSNIAEDAIKKNRWDSEDYNGMDEKKFKSLNWKKYAIKEFGLNDIEATWSITPWDKAFKKKTGSYADNIIELELE